MTPTKKLRELAMAADDMIEMEYTGGSYSEHRDPTPASKAFYEAAHAAIPGLLEQLDRLHDIESRTVSILSAAKVPPCDDDGNGWEVDQRVRWLVQRVAELEANAVRMREYRFALDGIATDGKGNPIEETR